MHDGKAYICISTLLTPSKSSVRSKSSIHVMVIEAVASPSGHENIDGSVEKSLPGITVQFFLPSCG